MNLRQKRYQANRIAGMSVPNAARAAGYSESYIRHKAYLIERAAKVGIIDALEMAGLTDKRQAEELYKLTLDEDAKIRLAAWKHISELKKQVSNDIKLDQSKHYTKVEYSFRGDEEGDDLDVNSNRIRDKESTLTI